MAGSGGSQKADLEELKRLANLYTQSRVLPAIIPLALLPLMLGGAFLIPHLILLVLDAVEGPPWVTKAMLPTAALLILAWCVLCIWLMFKGMKRYGSSFYRGEGQAVLRGEGIPIWAWALYVVTGLGAMILSAEELLSIRWGLTTVMTSFGLFMLYGGKREKEVPLGIVLGGLLLIAAVATAAGLPTLFKGDWLHAFFLTLMTYIVGAAVITMIVVHLYNRWILRRLKGANPLGSQQ